MILGEFTFPEDEQTSVQPTQFAFDVGLLEKKRAGSDFLQGPAHLINLFLSGGRDFALGQLRGGGVDIVGISSIIFASHALKESIQRPEGENRETYVKPGT